MSITRALVLAGGGHAASSWETGLITGLAEEGFDVRNADLFVGTSAGARVALNLASEMTVHEIFERRTRASAQLAERPPMVDWAKTRIDLDRIKQSNRSPAEILQQIGALALAVAVGKGADRRQIVTAQLSMQTWPERRMLIAAVNAETGERRAFDRDSGIDLVDAIIATTAFIGWGPALFQGHHYVDGGFYSSDNADLAIGFDRVLILALPSSPAFPSISLVSLDASVSILRDRGARVEVVHPDEHTLDVFNSSGGLMNPAVSAPAAHAGREQGKRLVGTIAPFWL